jgi:hypothetical protein
MIHCKNMTLRDGTKVLLPSALIVIGMLPVWLAISGVIDLFSLPFSKTDYFDFNPHPAIGVTNATIGFPLLMAACLYSSSALAGRRFGIVSVTGAAFVAINVLTSILPNYSLVPTIPFYMINLIPLVAADVILSYRYWRPFKIPLYVAGAVVGLTFFTLNYPLITHTYNAVLMQESVWPTLTAKIYFKMIGTVFPLAAIPAASMGVLGAVAGDRLIAKIKHPILS